MSRKELYEILEKAGLDYDLVEIFKGCVLLRFDTDDEYIEEDEDDNEVMA
jgi:hypothetical protein